MGCVISMEDFEMSKEDADRRAKLFELMAVAPYEVTDIFVDVVLKHWPNSIGTAIDDLEATVEVLTDYLGARQRGGGE